MIALISGHAHSGRRTRMALLDGAQSGLVRNYSALRGVTTSDPWTPKTN